MSELEAQIANRRRKREELEQAGIAAFPTRAEYDLEPAAVHAQYDERSAEDLEATSIELRVPGRIRSVRRHGKTSFVDLHDGRVKLQVMIRQAQLDEASTVVLEHVDVGDYVLAGGRLIRTRTGELTLMATQLTLLAKAMRPLPEKWHGLTDVESRYRRRYLDLLFNEESRRVFEIRAALVNGMRRYLNQHDFLEVETPMMQPIPGGAAARPFVTHHNALDIDLYLRVAPELYLKRLLVGGLHRVYEINRNFRNEGVSTQHNPEFTMLEFYWAYSDYLQLMEFTESMLVVLAEEVLGRPRLEWQEHTLDLSPPFPRFTIRQAIAEFTDLGIEQLEDVGDLTEAHRALGLELPETVQTASRRQRAKDPGPPEGYGYLLMHLFETRVEPHLQAPTFITDYPVEISPLSKPSPTDPRFTERFELYMGGMEIANAFTELNDPEMQAQRFRQQMAARDLGDDEAHRFDFDYVRALEHGMPPAGGEGIGIDRLTMLFGNRASIRDVILFPLLKPELPEGP